MRDVGVIFVHGIFVDNPNFSDEMEGELRKRMTAEQRACVHFDSVYWAGEVRRHQKNFIANAVDAAGITNNRLRDFVLYGLGDAAAYQKTPYRKHSIYYSVHDKIIDALDRLDAVPQLQTAPLVFIGHSLGCHVISTFLWDLNRLRQSTVEVIQAEIPDKSVQNEWMDEWRKLQDANASPFRKLETVAGLVTLGNNMPLFTFAFGPDRVFPVTKPPEIPGIPPSRVHAAFPGIGLPPPLQDQAKWLNFFDKDDVLGFPLKPLNRSYSSETRITDIPVRSGKMARSVPFWGIYEAHVGYWTNPVVLDKTADLITSMM